MNGNYKQAEPKQQIMVNTDLLEYIKGSKTKKLNSDSHTRIEALQDLLSHQKETLLLLGKIQAVPFEETLLHLSDRWHWNRATVRTYLKDLEALGVIQMDITNKGIKIQFHHYIL